MLRPPLRWLVSMLMAICFLGPVIGIPAQLNTFPSPAQSQPSGNPLMELINRNDVVRSQSRQFEVIVPPITADSIKDPVKGIEEDLLRLNADLLVVMAEKVASSFYLFLGLPRKWESSVFFKINPELEPDNDVLVHIRRFKDKSQFVTELPYFISRKKLGRLLVRIVLHEFLLQHPGRYQEPPPLWLVRAMEREFLDGSLWRPLLEPNQEININQQFVDSLVVSHKALEGQIPLSFEELSFPPPEAMMDELRLYFDASAHIFMRNICELPGGKSNLVQWLRSYNNNLNWQIGFLQNFQSHFPTFLEIEKWWSIQGIKALRRNELLLLQPYESMTRLEQILLKVQPATISNADASRNENPITPPKILTLQEFLQDSTFREHSPELTRIFKHLLFLHAQSHPLVTDTIAIYIDSINAYLSHKQPRKNNPRQKNSESQSTAALNRLIKDLNKADLVRRLTMVRAAELKFGVVPHQDLIPNKGQRQPSTPPQQ